MTQPGGTMSSCRLRGRAATIDMRASWQAAPFYFIMGSLILALTNFWPLSLRRSSGDVHPTCHSPSNVLTNQIIQVRSKMIREKATEGGMLSATGLCLYQFAFFLCSIFLLFSFFLTFVFSRRKLRLGKVHSGPQRPA